MSVLQLVQNTIHFIKRFLILRIFLAVRQWEEGTLGETDDMDGYDGDTESYGELHAVCPKCAADVEPQA